MEDSVLDVAGAEIVGIICPVSICMLLVVLLVKKLQSEVTGSVLTSVASLIYSEDSADSDWSKFLGALVNAGVFVLVITGVTFLLVLLFYLRCTKCLRIYTALGAFTVLAFMGGTVGILLVQDLGFPIDAISASIILYNFSIVGVLSVFFCKVPILVTQGYLIVVGMLVAFWFTSLPEWTTWVLLVAISLYDVVAVLMPGGPLNLLLQLAMSRDEEIPALIYEARPAPSAALRVAQVMNVTAHATTQADQQSSPLLSVEDRQTRLWKGRTPVSGSKGSAIPQHTFPNLFVPLLRSEQEVEESRTSCQRLNELSLNLNSRRDLQSANEDFTPREGGGSIVLPFPSAGDCCLRNLDVHHERTPMVQSTALQSMHSLRQTDLRLSMSFEENLPSGSSEMEDEGIGLGASGAIKLGLGDFIFYSVLVGRAALYDMTTVYASYLAIITGLGATLGLLAVWRRALPALPISIALGVMFYFVARFLLEPFVMHFGGYLVFM